MKIAYIAHPIGGDVKSNLAKIQDVVLKINREEPETVPFAPYYLDCLILDDSVPEDRLRGIKNDHEFFERGFIDELRLYGDTISAGMEAEIELAREYKIPVIPMTTGTKTEFYGIEYEV